MADISRADALALINQQNMDEIWQEATANSVALSTFRRITMTSKQTKVRVLDVLPGSATFRNSDTAAFATTDQRWVNKYLEAESIGLIVPIPMDVFDDIDANVWGEVRPRVAEELGRALDAAVLVGAGAPTSWTTGSGGPGSIAEHAVAAGNVISRGSTEGVNLGAATLTASSDLVTTGSAHGLAANDRVRFGAITTSTGLTAGQDYYVLSSGLTSTAFKVATTPGGSAVDIATGDGSTTAVYKMNGAAVQAGRDLAFTISEAAGLIEADDYDPNVLVTTRARRRELRNLRDANGQYLYGAPTAGSGQINGGTVDGLDILYSRNGALGSTYQMILAAADHAVLGIRKDLTFALSDQATVNGVSMFETNQMALRVDMRVGFQISDATTKINGGTGSPFSVVTA